MKLQHPDTDLVVETDEEHVDIYLSQGWVEKPSSSSKK